jgi:cytochrome c biogenesis protein ResB
MVTQGQAVETPWPGITFTVYGRYDHARMDHDVVAVDPPRESAIPALRVSVKTAQGADQFWVRKGGSRTFTAGASVYRFTFDDRARPLGFDLTLDRFRIGYYPGTQRPRSFESQLTLSDPSMGRQQSHVVSMNRPVSHGDYTLYQSSYHQLSSGKSVSVLSVSWDPGKPVVFAGYIMMFLGMIWMLVMRRLDSGQQRNGGGSWAQREGSTGP